MAPDHLEHESNILSQQDGQRTISQNEVKPHNQVASEGTSNYLEPTRFRIVNKLTACLVIPPNPKTNEVRTQGDQAISDHFCVWLQDDGGGDVPARLALQPS